jgi:hypothetical protein
MIHIHNKLWYVINPEREDNLAYMTHYEEDDKFPKRKATGLSWANAHREQWQWDNSTQKSKLIKSRPVIEDGIYVDNTPLPGFYIGDSVSRWTTENKLFRVTDPRGFSVEVPVGNISTLLHLTTVVKGVIQEECAWGKEGNNHVLLPVNSEPFIVAKEKTDILKNGLLTMEDIKPGDYLQVFNGGIVYYAGRAKLTWELHEYKREGSYYSSEKKLIRTVVAEDKKWVELFLENVNKDGTCRIQGHTLPKIESVISHEVRQDLKVSGYPPERVIRQVCGGHFRDNYNHFYEGNIISVRFKEGK